jgi:hypothetical protein
MFQLHSSTKSKLLSASLGLSMVLAVATQSMRADIIINGYTAATNDRFTNDAAFVGAGFNFSGVGQMQGAGNLGWATAISRNVVISAAHAFPANAISFYASNDPAGTLVTRNIIPGSGVQIPGTDLYLAVLDSNLPASIVHYNYATQALSGPAGSLANAGIYQNLNTFMFGRSPAVHPDDRDQAVGRNRITGYVENVNFNGNPNVDALLMFFDDSSSPDFVPFEALFQGGDSGGPTFVEVNGQLVLLGTNAFIGTAGSATFSGINYTGNQAAFITNFINSVPEPTSFSLFAVGSLAVLMRRRRSA